MKKCRRKDDKCCVALASVLKCVFFSHATCKNTCKTLSSQLLLSSILPPCSPLSLFVHSPSLTWTQCFAPVSSFALRPGALIIGPLISAKSLPFQQALLRLSPFSCFPALCPFPLSSRCFILPSLCCARSCGQLGAGRIDLASRCVSHRAIWCSAYAPMAGRSRKADKVSACRL